MYSIILIIRTKLNLPLDNNEKISKTRDTREHIRKFL